MNVWGDLKKRLNQVEEISENNLRHPYTGKIYHDTLSSYIELLINCGFIKRVHRRISKTYALTVVHYVPLRNIPEKLTIKEATFAYRQPWILWFKYPESEQNINEKGVKKNVEFYE